MSTEKHKAWDKARAKVYRETHREELNAKQKIRYARDREKLLEDKRAHYAANREEHLLRQKDYISRNYEKVQKRKRVYRENNVIKEIVRRAKHRAAQKGWDFNLKDEDILLPERCPILGVLLEMGKGRGPKSNSPTLDRIDSTKGYIAGNVHVISMRANLIKTDANADEILAVGNYMKKLQSG
jgi:hypothetical protein